MTSGWAIGFDPVEELSVVSLIISKRLKDTLPGLTSADFRYRITIGFKLNVFPEKF